MEVIVGLIFLGFVCSVIGLAAKGRSHENHIDRSEPAEKVHRSTKRSGGIRTSPKAAKPRSVQGGKATRRGDEGLALPPIPASLTVTGKAYVIDGDTIRIGKTKIRISGIDAPEIDMPYGQKSKWAMVKICKGHIVTANLDGERSYDRLVGTCFLPDGTDIGAEIVKQGLALDLAVFQAGNTAIWNRTALGGDWPTGLLATALSGARP